jgi:DNA-binding CsgD family transcriptional regulator/tetratricopeptide (TPR) repeat protein
MGRRPSLSGGAEASRLVEIAHHWTAANRPSRALTAAIAAADASRAVFAYAEAARQYEHATDTWDLVPAEDRPSDRDLGDLLGAASDVALLIGDGPRAVDFAERAVEAVDAAEGPEGDVERRARARERLGHAASLAGDTATSIRLLQEAVGLFEEGQPVEAVVSSPNEQPSSSAHARVLTGLAANLMLGGRSGDSRPVAERAIAAARASGDQGIESRAMSILGVDLATLGNLGAGIDLLRRSLELADPADDPAAIPRAQANLGTVLEMAGFVEEALDVSFAGVESTRRYGTEMSFTIFLEANAAAMLIELGRYPEATELLEGNIPRALPGVSTVNLYLTLAHLAIRTGDLASARRHLQIARAEARGIEDAQYVIDLYRFQTEIELWEGDPDSALATAREGFDRLAQIDDAVILGQLAIPAVHAAADLAVKARASRRAEAAQAAVDAARDVVERYRASTARMTAPDALAEHEIGWHMSLCLSEVGRASGDDGPDAWDAVRPAVQARPAPFLEAYVLWRAAEAYAGQSDAASAAERLRAAHAIAASIGASLLLARIESLGRRLRVAFAAAAVPTIEGVRGAPADGADDSGPAVDDTPTPAAPPDPFGLTEREREVLALVAEGYTNRRIASELFISDSTAGVHVSHILAKLEVESRTEAAAIAVRLGLDKDARV